MRGILLSLIFVMSGCGVRQVSHVTDFEPHTPPKSPTPTHVTVSVADFLVKAHPQLASATVTLDYLQHHPVGRTKVVLKIHLDREYEFPLIDHLGVLASDQDRILITRDAAQNYQLELFYSRIIDRETCTGAFPEFTCQPFVLDHYVPRDMTIEQLAKAAGVTFDELSMAVYGPDAERDGNHPTDKGILFIGTNLFASLGRDSSDQSGIVSILPVDMTTGILSINGKSVGRLRFTFSQEMKFGSTYLNALCTEEWDAVCTIRHNEREIVSGITLKN